jgi:serine/threonine-protein kinase HipA
MVLRLDREPGRRIYSIWTGTALSEAAAYLLVSRQAHGRLKLALVHNPLSRCDAFGLLPAQAARTVARVMDVRTGWQARFVGPGVTAPDLRSLAERIDGEALPRERMGSDPARDGTALVTDPRTGPFRRH